MSLAPALPPAHAFWAHGDGAGSIRSQTLDPLHPDQVLVRTRFSAISRGTESLVFRGEVPPGERVRMRAPFQEGEFGGPLKYGYSNVGVVEAGPPALLGKPVFCLFPHQTAYVVPATAVHPIPATVPPSRAVLAANLETAINGLWDARPSIGDRICVVGGGVVGLLVAWLAAAIPGCTVELADVNPAREETARKLGVASVPVAEATPDADLVIHASGNPDGLRTALRLAGQESTVLEMSWYGVKPVTLPLGEAFHSRRLSLRSSQVGTIALQQRARWSHARRMALALALLADDRLDALISGDTPFLELPRLMARLAARDPALDNALCERITYT